MSEMFASCDIMIVVQINESNIKKFKEIIDVSKLKFKSFKY